MNAILEAPQTLSTQRLVLRPPAPDDAGAIAKAIGDWDVVKNLARVPWPYERRHAEAFLRDEAARRAADSERTFVIDDGSLCGLIGVRGYNGSEPANIGYWLARRVWGRGYATEAVNALVSFAFEYLPTEMLAADVVSDNPASMRVLEKAGFSRIGTATCPTLARGALDAIEFRLARTDWLQR